jgi:hypothetical protein
VPWGVAAAAVSAGGAIYNSEQGQKNASKVSAPLAGAQNTLYSDAEQIAATPYTPYTGQQVADLSANQVKANAQAADETTNNEAQDYINKAGGQADFIAGNQWNTATANKYMNPYTQDVTDIALNQENQAYAKSVNANNASAASTGAFGGDRAALTNVGTTGQHLQAQGNIEAEGNANAYASALQAWQSDNQRASSATTAYQNSGNDITNMNASQIKDLLATGGADQAVQQMKLTTGYNNYLDQRNWATNQLAPLESAAGRTPTLAATQPTNYASSLVGVGSALAGYFGSANSTNNNSDPFAGTNLANNSSSFAAYNQNNAPTAGDIANDTQGINNINVGSIDTGETPTANMPDDSSFDFDG